MKWLVYALLGLGLCSIAAYGIVKSNNRKAIAEANARQAESEENAAVAAESKAKQEAKTASNRAAAEASAAKKAEELRLANEAERDKAKFDAEKAAEDRAKAEADAAKAADDRAKAEAENAKASAERSTALAARETARLEAAKAKSLAEAEVLKAQAEADALAREKLKSDKVIAEAKLYELRQLDLESLEKELLDYKRELDERERALHPDKTIKDLVSLGDGESADGTGGPSKSKAQTLAENDTALPKETRRLARARRIAGEDDAALAAANRKDIVARLEKLYVSAVKEDRMVDADFYRKELKRMYPDWKLELPAGDGAGDAAK